MWTGLFVLAATIRKHVKIPKIGLLGGWDCYPNLYVVLVGPPGIARKSTTMNFGDELLRALPEIPASPTKITEPALYTEICESADGSIYITASELSEVINKSKMDMFDFLTTGYDIAKPLRGRTIMRGGESVENPCINMFACTQESWIVENMPVSVIGGGFASRTMFILETKPRKRQLYYTELDYNELEKIKANLIEDLVHISTIHGEFAIDDEAIDWMEAWYRTIDTVLAKSHPNIRGYLSRRHVHAHKVAMLLHLAYSDELVLSKTDFELATQILEQTEIRVEALFKKLGKHEYVPDLGNILEYITTNKKVPHSLLLREFQAVAGLNQLQELIDGLVAMKLIQAVRDEDDNLCFEAC
jgi:hypothetical protein